MEKTILQEAFQQLNMLNEEDYNISGGAGEGIDELADFVNSDEEIDEIEVIDPEAETEDDLEDSYIGKVILDCEVCHSKLYKNKEEVSIDESSEEALANVGEECPYCYSSDGYKVIGEVSPFSETEVDVDIESKDDIDGNIEDIEDIDYEDGEEDEDKKVDESFSRKRMNEDFNTYFGFDCPPGSDCANQIKDALKKAGYTNFSEIDTRPGNEPGGGLLYIGFDWDGRSSLSKAKAALSEIGIEPVDIVDESLEDEELPVRDGTLPHPERFSVVHWRPDQNKASNESLMNEGKRIPSAKQLLHDLDSLEEGLENLDIETEHDKIHIDAQEKTEEGEEMITPLSPETENEIMGIEDEVPMDEFSPDMEKEPIEDTFSDEDTIDLDIDDFDEGSFDELGESYLRNVYENVESYKTSSVKSKGNSLVVEGMITFKSGKERASTFIFEANNITKAGKASFIGKNESLSKSNKAFELNGTLKEGKFISESLNYSYRKRVNESIKRVHGKVTLRG